VAKLAGDGWPARGGAGRLFFDDTLVFITIVMFGHCWDGMTSQDMPLYSLESLPPVRGRFGIDPDTHAVELAPRLGRFRCLRIALDER
jgi:hypothetical protein